jgi:hypothetical protein
MSKRTTASEAEISRAIMDYLAALHVLTYRMNTGAYEAVYKGKSRFLRFGTPGMADLLAFIKSPFAGLIVHWLEVKTATGKQSELQKSFQNQVEAAGHRYSVVRSIEDVETALK